MMMSMASSERTARVAIHTQYSVSSDDALSVIEFPILPRTLLATESTTIRSTPKISKRRKNLRKYPPHPPTNVEAENASYLSRTTVNTPPARNVLMII